MTSFQVIVTTSTILSVLLAILFLSINYLGIFLFIGVPILMGSVPVLVYG